MKTLFQRWSLRSNTGRAVRSHARRYRLQTELLEDRTLLSSYTAATVADLISDINATNLAGGSNTISLVAGKRFTLTKVDNTASGATGLSVIAPNNNLTIVGSGNIIERSTGTKIPAFRLLVVASGATLNLSNVTLQGGLVNGYSGWGGAIFNEGTLSLNGVTVQNNVAQGQGASTAGGAIWSSGLLTLQDCIVQNNQASGVNGSTVGAHGGNAYGGGLYVSGTASLTNVTLSSNIVQGGNGASGGRVVSYETTWVRGGDGGDGMGGGTFVGYGASVSFHNTTVNNNSASGGRGGGSPRGMPRGSDGLGQGGGLYLDAFASVCLDVFTQGNVTNNSALTSDPNIYGSYLVC